MNSCVSLCEDSVPVPATIGALARILTNRESEPRREKKEIDGNHNEKPLD